MEQVANTHLDFGFFPLFRNIKASAWPCRFAVTQMHLASGVATNHPQTFNLLIFQPLHAANHGG